MSRTPYKGVASFSESIFCKKEPRNTKYIFAEIVDYVFDSIKSDSGAVTFVQVGANDGVRGDPIFKHVKKNRWSGLLIEPAQSAMTRLKENYAEQKGLYFRNEAIWLSEGFHNFYLVHGEDVLSSFSLDTIMLHDSKYDDLSGMIEEVSVQTRRLDSLCNETGFETPDILAVDVEGCDDIIIRTFDFTKHRPTVIFFEHVALSNDASRRIANFLESLGYVLISDRHDCLCLLAEKHDKALVELFVRILKAAQEN